MIPIQIESRNTWDPIKEEFGEVKGFKVNLEHCLLSVSRWETITAKPFLDNKEKTNEELMLYIKCMSLDTELTDEQTLAIATDATAMNQIKEYIEAPLTATIVKSNGPKNGSGEFLTSELMYYWLVGLQIPFEVERWPLQRMIKLVEVCNAKNQPAKKMSKNDILRQNRALNQSRRVKKPRKR